MERRRTRAQDERGPAKHRKYGVPLPSTSQVAVPHLSSPLQKNPEKLKC